MGQVHPWSPLGASRTWNAGLARPSPGAVLLLNLPVPDLELAAGGAGLACFDLWFAWLTCGFAWGAGPGVAWLDLLFSPGGVPSSSPHTQKSKHGLHAPERPPLGWPK